MMEKELINAIGRRKAAVARVYLSRATAAATEITINSRPLAEYFPVRDIAQKVMDPVLTVGGEQAFQITATVCGGGLKGQAEALRLAIARALCKVDPEMRPPLKQRRLLTRDAREVERKKFGLRKARKSTQFSKR
ncbi:MAG: 30S ribosomal protein S9 [Saprospiraceae bacterium]|jgi:small subunit ribosomal protein S9|nr:30S ribosomal protein S9 [Saprospiraceae bacterium]